MSNRRLNRVFGKLHFKRRCLRIFVKFEHKWTSGGPKGVHTIPFKGSKILRKPMARGKNFGDRGGEVSKFSNEDDEDERTRKDQEHPLQDTWATIITLCDSLNLNVKKFREHQREIYPRLKLSALDIDEPEITAIQLPSYRMKHGQRLATGVDANDQDLELREGEIKLRCIQADSGILAVRSASHALSAVKRTRELDYRGQAGKSRGFNSTEVRKFQRQREIKCF
ncbi:hypothetical protein B0H14DRAFT_2581552 [Mycena olivaceomarginata]|nr:hypothetical protein B0H14DRAFT_2581552 [Mycena olivaceomarginata]